MNTDKIIAEAIAKDYAPKDNSKIIALSNGASLGFETMYKRMFENIFNPILERFHYPAEDRHYVMMYYLSGITAIITEWLKGNCEKPASSISGIIRECIFGLPGNEIIPAESAHWLQPPR